MMYNPVLDSDIDNFTKSLNIEGVSRVLDTKRYEYQDKAFNVTQDIDFSKKFSDFALWILLYFNERGDVKIKATKEKNIELQYRYFSVEEPDPIRVITLNYDLDTIDTYSSYSIIDKGVKWIDAKTIKHDNIYPSEIMKGIEKAKKCMGLLAYL